jgi:hypothetical protein
MNEQRLARNFLPENVTGQNLDVAYTVGEILLVISLLKPFGEANFGVYFE